MTLVLRWRVPPPLVQTRWRGPAGMLEAVRRDPLGPVAAVIGPPGVDAAKTERETAQSIVAGQAVRPNLQGRLVLAQADSMAGARMVALAASSAASGHPCTLHADFVDLPDWSAATGSAELQAGADYFLSAAAPGALLAPAQNNLLSHDAGDYPLVLAQNEGFNIMNLVAMGAAGVGTLYVNMELAEVTAY